MCAELAALGMDLARASRPISNPALPRRREARKEGSISFLKKRNKKLLSDACNR
jgi:ribosomal protein L13E